MAIKVSKIKFLFCKLRQKKTPIMKPKVYARQFRIADNSGLKALCIMGTKNMDMNYIRTRMETIQLKLLTLLRS